MLFVPGITASTAYQLGKLRDDEERTRKQLEEITATPATYERVLQKMDEQAQDAILHDEEKLRKEAHKIALLQQKISKEELKYAEMQRQLCEKEEKEAEIQEKKLSKAKNNAKRRLSATHREGSFEEVIHNVKDFAKGVLEDVAGLANHVFTDDKGPKEYDALGKREKKIRKAADRIDDLRKKLEGKRQATLEEDDKLLNEKAYKIEQLQMKLEDEEKTYARIATELAEDMQYEARIREEEQKLKEFEQGALNDQSHRHHRQHQHNHHQHNRNCHRTQSLV